jgi:hypothetical protein
VQYCNHTHRLTCNICSGLASVVRSNQHTMSHPVHCCRMCSRTGKLILTTCWKALPKMHRCACSNHFVATGTCDPRLRLRVNCSRKEPPCDASTHRTPFHCRSLYTPSVCQGAVLIYTFHPLVSGRGHRMKAMASLLDYLKGQGAEFATVHVAAELCKGWSVGGKPLLSQQEERLWRAGATFLSSKI